MEELKAVGGIMPILLLLISLQFAFIRFLVNKEFKRIESNLREHEQVLFGSKDNPRDNPGLITEFRLMALTQKTIVNEVSEIKSKLDTLPDKIVRAIRNHNDD